MLVITKTLLRWKLIITLLGLLLAPCGSAQVFGAQPKDAANLVLLEVRLDEHLLSESMTAYQFGNDVFLPLGELSKLLTIAIRTQPVEGRASGYVLDEQRGFSLDVIQREVTVSDRHETLDRALVKLQADDIYVASRLLARWLPADLEVDMSSLTLRVRPREKLPLQAGLERSERGKRGGARGQQVDPEFPRSPTPYGTFEAPVIDQTLGRGRAPRRRPRPDQRRLHRLPDRRPGGSGGATLRQPQPAGARDRPALDRWGAMIRTPNCSVRCMRAPRMIGSVPAPGVANIALNSATGNGVTIGNRPLNQPTRFDRHSLQGALPPGWDVELFFNEALIAFQQSRPDGKYTFDDLPLVYGTNEFRLVFHGPLGQLRVERQNFLLEQSLLAPGQVYYSLTDQHDEHGRSRRVAQFDSAWPSSSARRAGWCACRWTASSSATPTSACTATSTRSSFAADLARSDTGGSVGPGGAQDPASRAWRWAPAMPKCATSPANCTSRRPIRCARATNSPSTACSRPAPRLLPLSLQVKRDRLASDAQNIELLGRVSDLPVRHRDQQCGALAVAGRRQVGRRRAAGEPPRGRHRGQRTMAVHHRAALCDLDRGDCRRQEYFRQLPAQCRARARLPGPRIPPHRRPEQEPGQLRPRGQRLLLQPPRIWRGHPAVRRHRLRAAPARAGSPTPSRWRPTAPPRCGCSSTKTRTA